MKPKPCFNFDSFCHPYHMFIPSSSNFLNIFYCLFWTAIEYLFLIWIYYNIWRVLYNHMALIKQLMLYPRSKHYFRFGFKNYLPIPPLPHYPQAPHPDDRKQYFCQMAWIYSLNHWILFYFTIYHHFII